MRKSEIKKILQETERQLKALKLENEQLSEKLKAAKKKLKAAENSDIAASSEIAAVRDENAELKSKIKNIDEQNKAHEAELEERLNQTGNELNKLKGDYFDLSSYADELEARLASSAKPSENGGNDENKTEKLPPAPKISRPLTADAINEDLFNYASDAISKAIIKSSAVKNAVAESHHELTSELLPLAVGKTEMLKSDILQTVISTELDDDGKRAKIDDLLNESIDYYNSLLGQIV